jgi:hypothetical protein
MQTRLISHFKRVIFLQAIVSIVLKSPALPYEVFTMFDSRNTLFLLMLRFSDHYRGELHVLCSYVSRHYNPHLGISLLLIVLLFAPPRECWYTYAHTCIQFLYSREKERERERERDTANGGGKECEYERCRGKVEK